LKISVLNYFIIRSTGGIEAEQAVRTKLNEEEQKNIADSVNALVELRRKKNMQITTSTSKDNADRDEVKKIDSTDNFIVSKDYYDENDSSDDSSDDSVGEIVETNQLVHEINSNNEDDDECDVSEHQHVRSQSTVMDITLKDNCDSHIGVGLLKNNKNVINKNINDAFKNKLVMVNEEKNIDERPVEMYTNRLQTFRSNQLNF